MSSALQDRTVFPPDEPSEITPLLRAIAPHTGVPILVGPEGDQWALPDEAYRVLVQVLEAMSHGLAITVMPQHTQLTTQEAADLLGISRPTLVKLLEGGTIPYSTPGRHRRLNLVDVLAYKREAYEERESALTGLAADAQEQGLYEATATPVDTR